MYIEEPGNNILNRGNTRGVHGSITPGLNISTYEIPCSNYVPNGNVVPGIDIENIVVGPGLSMEVRVFNGLGQIDSVVCVPGAVINIQNNAWTFGASYILSDGLISGIVNPLTSCK